MSKSVKDKVNPIDYQKLIDLNRWIAENNIDVEALLMHVKLWYGFNPDFRGKVYKHASEDILPHDGLYADNEEPVKTTDDLL